jgi:hypothetical protein
MTVSPASRSSSIRSVIGAVLVEAVRASHARGVVILEDASPQGELAHAWLVESLGTERVWRVTSLASNVHGADAADAQLVAARGAEVERQALLAHPASKTELLLGGRVPRADLFPFGDLYASQVAQLASGCTLPPEVAALAGRAGGLEGLDAALMRLIDGREPLAAATSTLPREARNELAELYERGRFHRLHPRLVPKLSARTLGVDLFD